MSKVRKPCRYKACKGRIHPEGEKCPVASSRGKKGGSGKNQKLGFKIESVQKILISKVLENAAVQSVSIYRIVLNRECQKSKSMQSIITISIIIILFQNQNIFSMLCRIK